MRRHRLFGLFGLFGLLALVSGSVAGQDEAAGQPGSFVATTFRAFIVTDDRWPPAVNEKTQKKETDPKDRTNKIHDLVTEFGLNPMVAIFVRTDLDKLKGDATAGRFGVGKLALEVNNLLTDKVHNGVYKGARLAGFVMFLKLDFFEAVLDEKGEVKKSDKQTGWTKLVTVKNPAPWLFTFTPGSTPSYRVEDVSTVRRTMLPLVTTPRFTPTLWTPAGMAALPNVTPLTPLLKTT